MYHNKSKGLLANNIAMRKIITDNKSICAILANNSSTSSPRALPPNNLSIVKTIFVMTTTICIMTSRPPIQPPHPLVSNPFQFPKRGFRHSNESTRNLLASALPTKLHISLAFRST